MFRPSAVQAGINERGDEYGGVNDEAQPRSAFLSSSICLADFLWNVTDVDLNGHDCILPAMMAPYKRGHPDIVLA